ncbi:MAG: hypothetical protein AAGG44_07305 [Planctomycetota bacterium]
MSGWWVVGSVGEAAFFGALFLLGVVSLTTVVSWQVFWPDSTILKPGFGFWLMVTASISFIVIGLSAFVLQVSSTLASPEMRTAIASRVKEEHRRRAAGEHSIPEDLNLPDLKPLMDSPGVRLAYRLAAQRGERTPLLLSTVFALTWNTMVAVFAAVALQQFLSGGRILFLALLLLPFLAVSFFATRWFFRLFLQRLGIGPTAVEVDVLPMLPGGDYRIYMCQYGRVDFRGLKVSLVASEEVTYEQGTDVRTESREHTRIPVLVKRMDAGAQDVHLGAGDENTASTPGLVRPERSESGDSTGEPGEANEIDLVADPEKPLELDCFVSLPIDIMHSFHSEHNALVWRIVVEGECAKWPAFCRSFPVAVYPRSAV